MSGREGGWVNMQTVVKMGLSNYRIKIWECGNWGILITVDTRMVLGGNIGKRWKRHFCLCQELPELDTLQLSHGSRYHVHTVIDKQKL